MQVLLLLYGGGMLTIATILILTILALWHAAVKLVAQGMLVDFEILHLLMFEEGVVAGHLVGALMVLILVLGHSEVRA